MERTFREYDGNFNLSVSEIGKMHLGALNEVHDNCRVILRTHMNTINRNGAPQPRGSPGRPADDRQDLRPTEGLRRGGGPPHLGLGPTRAPGHHPGPGIKTCRPPVTTYTPTAHTHDHWAVTDTAGHIIACLHTAPPGGGAP